NRKFLNHFGYHPFVLSTVEGLPKEFFNSLLRWDSKIRPQRGMKINAAAVSASGWRGSNILRCIGGNRWGLGDYFQIGGSKMARAVRKARIKEVPLSEIKDDLSRFLREAEKQEIVITRHGKPAGVLIGFESEDDWFDYKLENDPRFLERVEQARRS